MITIGNNPNQENEALLLSPICLDQALTPDEIERIFVLTNKLEPTQATLNGKVETESRSCKTAWLPYDDEHAWLYGRLYDLVCVVNEHGYFFDPIDFVEPIMYCEYDVDDHYGWHTDLASHPPFSSRKLAITVQLSASDDYRGGTLEFAVTPETTYTVSRAKGSVLIYPTYIAHRIQPVTKGKRKSLVFWVGGTSFQ